MYGASQVRARALARQAYVREPQRTKYVKRRTKTHKDTDNFRHGNA
jgi:hypothetical protein